MISEIHESISSIHILSMLFLLASLARQWATLLKSLFYVADVSDVSAVQSKQSEDIEDPVNEEDKDTTSCLSKVSSDTLLPKYNE
jgi:hypothetical protein